MLKPTLTTLLVLLLLGLNLGSCKTQEEIKREQLVDTLAVQMGDTQKMNAEHTTTIQDLEERFNQLSGLLEELGHDQKSQLQNKSQLFNQRISLLEAQSSSLQKMVDESKIKLARVEKKLKNQSKYLKKVLSGLTNISDEQKDRSPYEEAMNQYKKRHYSKARKILMGLESENKIKGKRRARILHNLGMIGNMTKKDDQAMIYLSKLFTEFPKSSYNRNGLLVLGRSFKRANKNKESQQTFKELIKRFPKSKQAKQAKKLIK